MPLRSALVAALVVVAAEQSPAVEQPAVEPLPPPQYTVTEDEPRTGTRIRRNVVAGNLVPLNRTYAQLTDAEKQIVKSQWQSIAPDDEPPYPADGLLPVQRAIQKVAQATDWTGPLALVAKVDAAGTVTAVDLLRPADPTVVARAADVLMHIRFKPAVCSGRSCAMDFPFRMQIVRDY